MTVFVQKEDFDPGAEIVAFTAQKGVAGTGAGAVVSFLGIVRGTAEDGLPLKALEIEHYPEMCERRLRDFTAAAGRRWPLIGSLIIHRVGLLAPGDRIVLVAVAAGHRGEAFAACSFLADLLKTEAPFWKCEITAAGRRWLDSKPADLDRAASWVRHGTQDPKIAETRRES